MLGSSECNPWFLRRDEPDPVILRKPLQCAATFRQERRHAVESCGWSRGPKQRGVTHPQTSKQSLASWKGMASESKFSRWRKRSPWQCPALRQLHQGGTREELRASHMPGEHHTTERERVAQDPGGELSVAMERVWKCLSAQRSMFI